MKEGGAHAARRTLALSDIREVDEEELESIRGSAGSHGAPALSDIREEGARPSEPSELTRGSTLSPFAGKSLQERESELIHEITRGSAVARDPLLSLSAQEREQFHASIRGSELARGSTLSTKGSSQATPLTIFTQEREQLILNIRESELARVSTLSTAAPALHPVDPQPGPTAQERARSDLADRMSELNHGSTLSVDSQPGPTAQERARADPTDRISELTTARISELTTATGIKTSVLEHELPSYLDESHTQGNRVHRSVRALLLNENNGWILNSFLRHLPKVLYAMALGLMLGSWAYPDGNDPSCPADDTHKNTKMCGMVAALEDGENRLYVLTSFILAGFLSSSRTLWMTRRSAYCALCGATRNLVINITTIMPQGHRKTMARWAALGYELSVLKARMLIDTDEARDFLKKSNLVVKDEWERMVNGDRHTTVWYWVQAKAKLLRDKGKIPDVDFHTICNAVTLSRDRANDLMSVIDRDQPQPYVSVCGLLVNLNIFFHTTAMGGKLSITVNECGTLLALAEPGFWTNVLFLLLYVTMFSLIFDVCSVLYNPFGPRDMDVPHGVVGKGIRYLAKSLSEEEDFPMSMGAVTEESLKVSIPRAEEQKLLKRFRPTRNGRMSTFFGYNQRATRNLRA